MKTYDESRRDAHRRELKRARDRKLYLESQGKQRFQEYADVDSTIGLHMDAIALYDRRIAVHERMIAAAVRDEVAV